MNKILKSALLLLALLLLAGLLAAWLLPAAVQALPGQVRGRLPEEILRAVTTPLATALPPPAAAPAEVGSLIERIIPTPKFTPIPTTTNLKAEPGESGLANKQPRQIQVPEVEPIEGESPLATPSPSPTPFLYPPQVRLQDLEIVPQKLNNCGPATLSINLNYYGLEHTQLDVATVVKPHYDDRNVSPSELIDYTNNFTNLRAALFRGGDLDMAKRLIAAGFPVVIEKGYEPDDWQGWMGHYLTLFGYDEQARQFVTIDTFLGPWDSSGRFVTYEEIETGWQQFNHTFYVVYEPEQEQTLREITGAVLNDEQAMWQQVMTQAQLSINLDPNNAFTWFNLGSSLTHLGQLTADPALTTAAATAFDQGRLLGLPPRMLWYQFEIYEAYLAAGRQEEVLILTTAVLENAGGRDVEETYLYRGHARLAQDDTAGAEADYRHALELKPGFSAAIEALNTLGNGRQSSNNN